ncbi:DNA recombination/repair protein [Heterostelium album PN500]|uniref:DNA repair protein RAD50 n=1 Tax=Heterostelium pallidum (strain ATCC 26659 / Pp 5 / PN500) TaxID=670386 RepID=D3AZD2_HETP5|nr:DNA recombination/repair protein [Heterostelium album PN500]EFA85515.1 DNA recombination/repair protein [Heterostelium album PN500]|eukprot:XP_020437623.1 DNA recombination/repair protein [Heterostelium album PN500]
MTSIEKLLVQGIRSFDPNESSVIDFYKPLTLIVGVNGAGKTTIIECLKYASTGEMPPNCSSGQAFIHDPKIAGNSEVKAQIKMRFKNPNGKPIVATRSLCLVQRANNKQEFRQMDASLQSFNSEGQKVSKSFRCSDLDKEIPELMGVAKPILKNVIFCHQEESLWPLSESAKLKVKFDEIFSAVRYTKALKSIKDKKKEVSTQIKESRLKLEVVTTNREHSNRINKEIAAMNQQLVTLKDTLKQTASQLKEKRQQYDLITAKVTQVDAAVQEVRAMEVRKVEMEKARDRMYSGLTEVFDESDAELVFMTNSFQDEVNQMLQAQKELSDNLAKLQTERDTLAAKKNSNSIEMGKLGQLLKMAEELAGNRDKQLAELASRYNLTYEPGKSQDVVESLTKKLNDISAVILANQDRFKQQISEAESAANESNIEKKQLEERINQLDSNLNANMRKLEQIDAEKKKVLSLSENANQYHQAIAESESTIEKLESDFQLAGYDEKIKSMIQQRKELEMSIEQKRTSITQANQMALQRSSLTFKQNELRTKQACISEYLVNNKAMLDDLLNGEYTAENLSSKLRDLGMSLESDSKERREESNDVNTQLIKSENELKIVIREKNAKIQQLEKLGVQLGKLDSAIVGDNIDDSIKTLSNRLLQLQKSLAILESEDVLYKEYIEKANNQKECSLCQNQMNDDDLHSFIHKLESHTDGIPDKLATLTKEIKTTKDNLEILTANKPMYELQIKLKQEEIPMLEKREQDIQQTLTESLLPFKKTIEESQQLLDNKMKKLNQMVLVASSVNMLCVETKKIVAEVEQQEQLLGVSGGALSVEQLNQEYDQLKSKSDSIQKEIERLTVDSKKNRSELNRLQQIVIQNRELLSKASGQTEIVEHLKQSEKELRAINEDLIAKLSDFTQQLEGITAKSVEFSGQLNSLREQLESESSKMTKEKTIFSNKLSAIKNLQQQIPSDLLEKQEKLESLAMSNREIDINIDSINEDYSKGVAHTDQIKNDLAQSEITKRVISDNLGYRQQKLNCESLSKEITKKNLSINSIITPEEQSLLKSLTADINLLKSKIDKSSGQVEAIEQHIRTAQTELAKPIYNSVETVYRDLLVQAETLELINKDLDKYYKALDKALMKYHVLKMDEINKTIRELWTATYRGNDIDTIEIRSDESTTAKKVINYRVVMLKGDVELDMRGRCSAGQKVLACLVIRLALAENFCTNCGILALDEPTSNLDRANIESFATALLNIIEAKKTQSGFQLIIITHDEEFVQYLGRGNFADYYWRVTKDANQHSLVERKEISKI